MWLVVGDGVAWQGRDDWRVGMCVACSGERLSGADREAPLPAFGGLN